MKSQKLLSILLAHVLTITIVCGIAAPMAVYAAEENTAAEEKTAIEQVDAEDNAEIEAEEALTSDTADATDESNISEYAEAAYDAGNAGTTEAAAALDEDEQARDSMSDTDPDMADPAAAQNPNEETEISDILDAAGAQGDDITDQGAVENAETAAAEDELRLISFFLDRDAYYVEVGQSTKITIQPIPEEAPYDSILFSTTDSDLVDVDESGVITGKEAGDATIRVDVYSGDDHVWTECTVHVLKAKIDLAEVKITGVVSKTYTGKQIKQNPTITLNGITLAAGTDYKINYENNIKAGKAVMHIEGMGDYTGTVDRTFTIAKANSSITKVTSYIAFPVSVPNTWKVGYYYINVNIKGEKSPVFEQVAVSAKAKKYLSVNKKGRIAVKKGIKCGTYYLRVRITEPASTNYKKSVVTRKIKITVKSSLQKYSSLKQLGVKGYSSSLDKPLNAAFDEMIMGLANDKVTFSKLSNYEKAYAITLYIGSHYYYKTGSSNAESMLKKGYGTCFAYSDLTYLMAKKAGLKNTWLTVPGKNVNHNGKYYGSQHRSVVTKIGTKYYELDSNSTYLYLSMPGGAFNLAPEHITESYAKYLLGKSKKYTSILAK